jgi:hypothetical protein
VANGSDCEKWKVKTEVMVNPHNSRQYKALFEGSGFFDARPWMCRAHCLGFPAGTKVFDVDVLIFRLQLTEVDGGLQVISVKGSF